MLRSVLEVAEGIGERRKRALFEISNRRPSDDHPLWTISVAPRLAVWRTLSDDSLRLTARPPPAWAPQVDWLARAAARSVSRRPRLKSISLTWIDTPSRFLGSRRALAAPGATALRSLRRTDVRRRPKQRRRQGSGPLRLLEYCSRVAQRSPELARPLPSPSSALGSVSLASPTRLASSRLTHSRSFSSRLGSPDVCPPPSGLRRNRPETDRALLLPHTPHSASEGPVELERSAAR